MIMATTAISQSSVPDAAEVLDSAVKLTPLQLNGIKLDAKHTILTPDYLDKLAQEIVTDEKNI